MPPSARATSPSEDGDAQREEIGAYKEAARVMFGFQDRAELEDLFRRKIVWDAMRGLDKALELTRAQGQPDEFALALAIERELLNEASKSGADLKTMFNDPNHHTPPLDEIAKLVSTLWGPEPSKAG